MDRFFCFLLFESSQQKNLPHTIAMGSSRYFILDPDSTTLPLVCELFSHDIMYFYGCMLFEQDVQIGTLIQSIGIGDQPVKEVLTDLYRVHLDSL